MTYLNSCTLEPLSANALFPKQVRSCYYRNENKISFSEQNLTVQLIPSYTSHFTTTRHLHQYRKLQSIITLPQLLLKNRNEFPKCAVSRKKKKKKKYLLCLALINFHCAAAKVCRRIFRTKKKPFRTRQLGFFKLGNTEDTLFFPELSHPAAHSPVT